MVHTLMVMLYNWFYWQLNYRQKERVVAAVENKVLQPCWASSLQQPLTLEEHGGGEPSRFGDFCKNHPSFWYVDAPKCGDSKG